MESIGIIESFIDLKDSNQIYITNFALGANPQLRAIRRPLKALLEARRRSMRDPTPDLRLQSSSDFNRIYITDFALGAILRLRATRRPLES